SPGGLYNSGSFPERHAEDSATRAVARDLRFGGSPGRGGRRGPRNLRTLYRHLGSELLLVRAGDPVSRDHLRNLGQDLRPRRQRLAYPDGEVPRGDRGPGLEARPPPRGRRPVLDAAERERNRNDFDRRLLGHFWVVLGAGGSNQLVRF